MLVRLAVGMKYAAIELMLPLPLPLPLMLLLLSLFIVMTKVMMKKEMKEAQ